MCPSPGLALHCIYFALGGLPQPNLTGKVKREKGGRRKGKTGRHESRNHRDIKFFVTALRCA